MAVTWCGWPQLRVMVPMSDTVNRCLERADCAERQLLSWKNDMKYLEVARCRY